MKPSTAMIPLLCIGLCALLVSCSDGGGSIYATIEVEKEVADSSLSNILTINDIVKTGTNEYYVAAGGIFRGKLDTAADTVDWTPNETDSSRPYNVSGGLCNALAWYGDTLYGGFVTTSTNLGLYKATAESDGTNSFIDSNVETITGADKQVTLLRSLHGHLFMVCAAVPSGGSNYVYELDYLASSTSSWAQLKTDIDSKIIDIVYDGANYWMVTDSAVYEDSSDPPTFATAATDTLGSFTVSGINGISAATDGRIFIPTKAGGVYYSLDNGGTWLNIAAPTISSTAVSYLTVAGPVDTTASTPNRMYVVGSDGYGYYTLTLASDNSGTLTRYSDSTIALYLESVRTILVDDTTVFMGTNTDGLWRTTFDSSTGAISSDASWTHE